MISHELYPFKTVWIRAMAQQRSRNPKNPSKSCVSDGSSPIALLLKSLVFDGYKFTLAGDLMPGSPLQEVDGRRATQAKLQRG